MFLKITEKKRYLIEYHKKESYKNMKYKAIIFDMDGTIVDTEKLWHKAGHILIERRGIVVTPDLKAELKIRLNGLALYESCTAIKNLTGLTEPVEQLIEEKRAIALDLYREGISFITGFEEFHRKVTRQSLKQAIATNADEPTIKKTNDSLNLVRFFGKHIYGISTVNFVCKPNPAIYMHAAGRLGVKPEECIAVEDSAFGIEAARSAGMKCIGINSGGDKERLSRADYIVDNYHEIDMQHILS